MSYEDLEDSRSVVEEDIQSVPRSVYLNSAFAYRNLGKLRDKLRVNQFAHKEFNPFITSKDGKRYYKGILNDKPLLKSVPNSIPLLVEDQHGSLDILVPQHIKYKNYNYTEIAK